MFNGNARDNQSPVLKITKYLKRTDKISSVSTDLHLKQRLLMISF